MDSKKIAQDVASKNVKKWLQEHPIFAEKSKIEPVNCKYLEEPLRWDCQNCSLILTSEIQAQEHFLGKKHNNFIKRKATYDNNTETNAFKQCSATRKRPFPHDKFQVSCNCRKPSFNHYWESQCRVRNIPDVIPPPAGRDNILETVIKSKKKTCSSSDLSIYRTPSGKYYCQPCNLTLNSQVKFLQHSESRKHKHKARVAFSKTK